MEQISALVDGELDRDEVARVVRGMKEQEELRDAWSTYHLIGEALRGERCLDGKVVQAVVARLDQEPTILAPRRSLVDSARRLALPSMAAAAAVATLAWIGLQTLEGPPSPSISSPMAELAVPEAMTPQTNALVDLVQPVSLTTPPSPSIQFPSRNIDAYLQAHREFSPSKTMQGLVSYARSVSAGTTESGR
jgi:sigma-E factor negative regulatory protein RseA